MVVGVRTGVVVVAGGCSGVVALLLLWLVLSLRLLDLLWSFLVSFGVVHECKCGVS